MKWMLTVAAVLIIDRAETAAQRAPAPADGTVFIRLVGSLHAEVDDAGIKQTVDRDQVEIGTGSGFVISPDGYVLTNDHVISDSQFVVVNGIRKVTVTIEVARIEACFSQEANARGGLSRCIEASVQASDPTLDLAVLYVNASNLPYVALGDSDVVRSGQSVDVLGFPFGRELALGLAGGPPDLVPEISTSAGTISAVRTGDTGERRFLQVNGTINPGNSGGPVVDRDGYAVGVVRLRVTGAAGIGFAIPINQVKDFLESHGLDSLMPVRRLRLGALQAIDGKGVALRLPEGLADVSPTRSRIETDPQPGSVTLRIDRGFSPWTARQLERTLVGSDAFERFVTTTIESQTSTPAGGAPILLGRARGTSDGIDREAAMHYGIVELGAEKLIARYVGSAEQVAYNESVLRDSLSSLDGQRLIVGEPVPVQMIEWSSSAATSGQPGLPVPQGWIVEPGAPSPCSGLPEASAAVAAFPVQDVTVALRAAVWNTGDIMPGSAAAGCSPRRGAAGEASYLSRTEWLGVSYSIEGAFIRLGPRQVVQLEVISPEQKSAFARALLAAWITKATADRP